MKIEPIFLAIVFGVVGLVPASAEACRVAAFQTPILHKDIPPPTDGLVVAEVEIVTDVRSSARPPLDARIISMIRGNYDGSLLRIDPQVISSCDGFPYSGQRGIIVGRILKSSDEALVIDPVRAPSLHQLQLESERGLVPTTIELGPLPSMEIGDKP